MDSQALPDTPRRHSYSIRRISLPVLEALLAHEEIRSDLRTAGDVLGCFVFLSFYIADSGLSSLQEAERSCTDLWMQSGLSLVEITTPVEITRTMNILWQEIEIERTRGMVGNDLKTSAGTLVLMRGLELLEIEDPDDPRYAEILGRVRNFNTPTRVIDVDTISIPCNREVDDSECVICCGGTVDMIKLRACNHIFCRECIDKWVNGNGRGATSNCPMCRADLLSSSEA